MRERSFVPYRGKSEKNLDGSGGRFLFFSSILLLILLILSLRLENSDTDNTDVMKDAVYTAAEIFCSDGETDNGERESAVFAYITEHNRRNSENVLSCP